METIHPAAPAHLPPFITAPGQTDTLMVVMAVVLVVLVLVIGNLYLRLHALPERMAHRGNKLQLEIVAVLALIALFTHNNLFWVAALLLALVDFPDLRTPLVNIAEGVQRLAGNAPRAAEPVPEPATEPEPARERSA